MSDGKANCLFCVQIVLTTYRHQVCEIHPLDLGFCGLWHILRKERTSTASSMGIGTE